MFDHSIEISSHCDNEAHDFVAANPSPGINGRFARTSLRFKRDNMLIVMFLDGSF